jgi:hypothetical protein
MFQTVVVLIFVAINTQLVLTENTKCSKEFETLHKCRKLFRETQNAIREKQRIDEQSKINKCFTSSGCNQLVANGSNDESDNSDHCKRNFTTSVHQLIKPCMLKHLNVSVKDVDQDTFKHGSGGYEDHSLFFSELTHFCLNDDQRNKTKACVGALPGSGVFMSRGDREKRDKERFNLECENKRECITKMSKDCQTIFNKTKSVRCDCARSEVTPKTDSLGKQLISCLDVTSSPADGDSERGFNAFSSTFIEMFVDHICANVNQEDLCNKPYQQFIVDHETVQGAHKGRR